MDKVKLLEYLNDRMDKKGLQVDRLVAEGSDDGSAILEWGIYQRIIRDIEKGMFDELDLKGGDNNV